MSPHVSFEMRRFEVVFAAAFRIAFVNATPLIGFLLLVEIMNPSTNKSMKSIRNASRNQSRNQEIEGKIKKNQLTTLKSIQINQIIKNQSKINQLIDQSMKNQSIYQVTRHLVPIVQPLVC